jgi:hypothetical protein
MGRSWQPPHAVNALVRLVESALLPPDHPEQMQRVEIVPLEIERRPVGALGVGQPALLVGRHAVLQDFGQPQRFLHHSTGRAVGAGRVLAGIRGFRRAVCHATRLGRKAGNGVTGVSHFHGSLGARAILVLGKRSQPGSPGHGVDTAMRTLGGSGTGPSVHILFEMPLKV